MIESRDLHGTVPLPHWSVWLTLLNLCWWRCISGCKSWGWLHTEGSLWKICMHTLSGVLVWLSLPCHTQCYFVTYRVLSPAWCFWEGIAPKCHLEILWHQSRSFLFLLILMHMLLFYSLIFVFNSTDCFYKYFSILWHSFLYYCFYLFSCTFIFL